MELDVLHKSHSPFIVEFYGAFFIESCVYYCMEYMDAGSLDRLIPYKNGAPEDILSRVAFSVSMTETSTLWHELSPFIDTRFILILSLY
jgi:serine/threonine protein kinase